MATITPAEFARRVASLSTPERLSKALRVAFIETSLDAEKRAKIRLSGGTLNARSGRLRSSLAASVRTEGSSLADVVLSAGGRVKDGSVVKYAAIHEKGGVITPKNGRFLRIPLPPALDATGNDRMATPLRQTAPGQFYVIQGEGGGLLLMNKETGAPWYLLVSSVEMPERPYLEPSMREASKDFGPRAIKVMRGVMQNEVSSGN